ncbi:MAG: asparaginase domain-containing protein [bacterium]
MSALLTEAVAVLTTGGTIDKVYFDARSEFAIGDSVVMELLKQAHVDAPHRLVEVMRKDSLDMLDADRQIIARAVDACSERCVVITHGTDTMTLTAQSLPATDKTIVLTGALSPARFAKSDATFNVGMAFAAVQTLPAGVYIVMNGQVFAADHVRKDLEKNVFVRC